MIEANIIPRCARCSELHDYVWDVGGTARSALGVVVAADVGYLLWTRPPGNEADLGVYVIPAAIAALLIWLPGLLGRWTAAFLATPRGERKYWKAKAAKQYRDMVSRGCKMTLDYRRNAFELLNQAQDQQASS
jgi:hypothetical protein